MTRMPFGKFKGRPISALPYDYLEWLIDEDFLKGSLRRAVAEEYERRLHSQEVDYSEDSLIDPKLADELIAAGLRTLSKKYHPDVGGSTAHMQAINAAAEWLRQQARRIEA